MGRSKIFLYMYSTMIDRLRSCEVVNVFVTHEDFPTSAHAGMVLQKGLSCEAVPRYSNSSCQHGNMDCSSIIGQCVKLCKLLAHNGHAMTCPFRNKQSLYMWSTLVESLYRGQMSIICFWLDLPKSTSHCQHNKNWRTLECPLKHRVYSIKVSRHVHLSSLFYQVNWCDSQKSIYDYMGVSLNGGTPQNTPKSSFLVGISHGCWGVSHHFRVHPPYVKITPFL